jgi:hypothetical protein
MEEIAERRIWDVNTLRAFMRDDRNSDWAVFDTLNSLFESWLVEFIELGRAPDNTRPEEPPGDFPPDINYGGSELR